MVWKNCKQVEGYNTKKTQKEIERKIMSSIAVIFGEKNNGLFPNNDKINIINQQPPYHFFPFIHKFDTLEVADLAGTSNTISKIYNNIIDTCLFH